MNDIEIIEKAINDGKEGIHVSGDHLLVPMRITGTGVAKRNYTNDIGEKIEFDLERPIDEFQSDKFLKSCVGLPVLMFHPDGGEKIDFENYSKHNIGNILYPYVKGDEVWGYARINDLRLLEALESGINSTSPLVTSRNYLENGKLKEEFQDINHLAIVVKGRWDTENPAIVKDILNIGEETMNEEAVDKAVDTSVANAVTKTDKCDEDEALLAKDVTLDSQLVEQNKLLIAKISELIDIMSIKKTDTVAPIEKIDEAEEVKAVMPEVPAPEEKTTIDEVLDENDEREKEEIANKIAGLSDMANAEMKILRPAPRSNEKAGSYLSRFLKLNKANVDTKYHCLLDKSDASILPLGKEALDSLQRFISVQNEKKNSEKPTGTILMADGSKIFDITRRG